MQLPNAESVSAVLAGLLGEDQPVTLDESGGPALEELKSPYVSVCLGDDQQPVCAIIADLTAAVSLGGQLMMLPIPGLEDQIEENDPTQMVVEACSEVFNNLTTTINRIEGNPHIVSRPAKPFADAAAEDVGQWMASASERIDYTGDFCCGTGRVVVLKV